MTSKTITLDSDAYNLLAFGKKRNESFSKIIKTRLRPPKTASNLLKNLDKCILSEETIDNIDSLIAERKSSVTKIVSLD